MAVNYAEIGRIGKFEVDFQQIPFFLFKLKFSHYCCEIQLLTSAKKVKHIFLDIISKMSHFNSNCIGQTKFGHKFNFRVDI